MATICVSRAHKTMHTPFHTADSSPSASASAHPSHRKPRSREQMCGVLGSRVTDPIQKRAETPRKYLEFSHSMRPYCPLLFCSSPLICFSCIYTNVCVCVCMYMRVVVCGTCICFSFFVFFFLFCFLHAHVHFLLSIEFNGVEWRPHCLRMCEYLYVWVHVRVAKGEMEGHGIDRSSWSGERATIVCI